MRQPFLGWWFGIDRRTIEAVSRRQPAAEISTFLGCGEFRRAHGCGMSPDIRRRRSLVNSYYKIAGLSSMTAQSSMK
jgi:hypothetical protein